MKTEQDYIREHGAWTLGSKIVKARKSGGSITLTLTKFVEEGKYYSIQKKNGEIIIREVPEASVDMSKIFCGIDKPSISDIMEIHKLCPLKDKE